MDSHGLSWTIIDCHGLSQTYIIQECVVGKYLLILTTLVLTYGLTKGSLQKKNSKKSDRAFSELKMGILRHYIFGVGR